jgi:hypothetical protein
MPPEPETAHEKQDRAAQLAEIISKGATEEQRIAIAEWLRALISIAEGDASPLDKTKQAVEETTQRRIIWPVVALLAAEIKRQAWDDRSLATRLISIGVFPALAFGGAAAASGAALGTAVGAPLWIVFGAGGAFAGALLNEMQKATSIRAPYATDSMSVEEGFKILGLELGATEAEIGDAHRRLMKGLHPDAGGSTYLAAQLNRARDIALRHIR